MRRHLSYANVAATLALVLAMSGGALAANHYLITSTSQLSPKVIKKLKGDAGRPGHEGAPGREGKEGSQGKEGREGKEGLTGGTGNVGGTGRTGATGPTGDEGREGKEGREGPRGPSEAYEVEFKGGDDLRAAGQAKTLSMTNLPPGAYAIYGKADIGPQEPNEGTSNCVLRAGREEDVSFAPLNRGRAVTVTTEITNAFATTGTVTMSCTGFEDPWLFYYARLVAIRVNALHQTTAEN